MSEQLVRLDSDDVRRAMAAIDPVAMVAEELIGRTIAGARQAVAGRLVPWTGTLLDEPDSLALEPAPGRTTCVLPGPCLRLARSAALAALAARELMMPGGVTVAVVGTATAIRLHLAVIARHMPDISHVAVHQADAGADGQAAAIPLDLVDQLELSGVRLTVAGTAADAVFGANLVVVAGDGPAGDHLDALRLGRFARGTVLVNATGHDLPAELVDRVEDVYVDDLGLLADHSRRQVVAAHLAAEADGSVPGEPRIVTDLGLLLTGRVGPRRRVDGIVLVELLGVAEVSTELAHRICAAARQAGIGTTHSTGDDPTGDNGKRE